MRDTDMLVNAPKSTPTKTCMKCFGLKFLLSKTSSINTKIAWNMNVATPISIAQTRSIAYGIELTGAEPNPDLIENATPNVMRYRPKI